MLLKDNKYDLRVKIKRHEIIINLARDLTILIRYYYDNCTIHDFRLSSICLTILITA